MDPNISTSIVISILALGVIFLVLTILIFTIKTLVHFIPYKEPPPPPAGKRAPQSPAATNDEHIAAITSALAAYLGKSPEEFRVTSIKPL